ncbi:MAG: hypothetical protein LBG92_08910 [Prevotellaceae bacterium]|jgi:hypothetical protein|nr:hypothetical protein [Prevotellaceae bacterium]
MNISYLLRIAVLVCFTACGSEGNEEVNRGEILPDNGATVPEWARAKNQKFQLVGKVKSFKETTSISEVETEYKFDNSGNLTEEYEVLSLKSPTPRWRRTEYSYDHRLRVIKRTEYSSEYPHGQIVYEYEYDGSHGVYLPCRCDKYRDEKAIFLQPGLTKLKIYDIANPVGKPLISTCTVKDGQLVFNVVEGDFGHVFDVIRTGFTKLTVDCKGYYPVLLKGYDASNHKKLEMSLTQKNGFPDVLTFENEKMKYSNVKNIPEWTLFEKYDTKGNLMIRTEKQYNDKGLLIGRKILSGTEERYTYEYDAHGNWTKCTKETLRNRNIQWYQDEVLTRIYAYF